MGRVRDPLPPGVARAMRVDRTTALGNPYRMEREGERGAACDAYTALVEATMSGDPSPDDVAEIGRAHGFTGEVRRWDAERARERLRHVVGHARTGALRLDCGCAPRRCHADFLAQIAMRAAAEE